MAESPFAASPCWKAWVYSLTPLLFLSLESAGRAMLREGVLHVDTLANLHVGVVFEVPGPRRHPGQEDADVRRRVGDVLQRLGE